MITRRNLLAGMSMGAGASLLSPFFRQAMATGPTPCRFVIVVEGNCIEPITMMSTATRAAIDAQATNDTTGRRWFPDRYGHTSPLTIAQGDLGTARSLDPLLGTAGPDLTARSAVVLGLSSLISGGGHTTHCGALSSTRSGNGRPGGQTIDALLAAIPGVRQQTPFDAIRLGVDAGNSSLAHYTCAYGEGRSAPVIVDPTLAFNNLFGSVASAAGQASFNRRSELLDFANGDVNAALAQFSGNSAERAKLEEYLSSIEAIALRQQRLTGMSSTLTAVSPVDPATNPLYSSTDPLDHLQAQFDLATAALQGGLTNVAVLTSGTGAFDMAYPSIISGVQRHDLHHGSGGNQTYIDAIHDVTRAHVSMIAKMARALLATPEGNGTMLDNTVILYMPDNGEQHHSQALEWPCLLVGGQAMGLQTDGRTVVYPGVRQSQNRQMSNMFNTLGYAAGVDLTDFGKEGTTRIAEGPLSEIFT